MEIHLICKRKISVVYILLSFCYRDLYFTEHSNVYEANSKTNSDLNSLYMNKQDSSAACKDSDISDESVFDFNRSEESVNSLRNRGGNRINSRTNSDVDSAGLNWRGRPMRESPVWCMDFSNDLIILGCADGRVEFWEASTGKLMVSYFRLCVVISKVVAREFLNVSFVILYTF